MPIWAERQLCPEVVWRGRALWLRWVADDTYQRTRCYVPLFAQINMPTYLRVLLRTSQMSLAEVSLKIVDSARTFTRRTPMATEKWDEGGWRMKKKRD